MLEWPTSNEKNSAGLTVQGVSGPLFVPLEIPLACGIEAHCGKTVFYGIYGRPAQPLMYLGVSIRKGETARSVVVGGGKITPLARVNAHDEKAIIDRIRMLVHREPCHRGLGNLRRFQKLEIIGVKPSPTCR